MLEHLRPSVRAMAGYTPGEQPRVGDVIKLNTNENPYPPAPRVLDALREAIADPFLRKYPDPVGAAFRQAAGSALGVDPDSILIGNGSDDILTILTRAFVPEGGLIVAPTPSYILYRTLADIQGARFETVPFTPDWQLPTAWPIRAANLTLVPNPNSPSGSFIPIDRLARLAEEINGPLVIDEAYVDFAGDHALRLITHNNVIVTRTLSKSYALAGIRFGFGVADPTIIRALIKIKDSYNCDVLSLAAATAAIADQDHMRSTRTRILATRDRLGNELRALGFDCCPSHSNFIWCRHEQRPVQPIFEELKRRGILVRYMNFPDYGDGLRITIGTDNEIDRLLTELSSILNPGARGASAP